MEISKAIYVMVVKEAANEFLGRDDKEKGLAGSSP
jgi:hypothetical protein